MASDNCHMSFRKGLLVTTIFYLISTPQWRPLLRPHKEINEHLLTSVLVRCCKRACGRRALRKKKCRGTVPVYSPKPKAHAQNCSLERPIKGIASGRSHSPCTHMPNYYGHFIDKYSFQQRYSKITSGRGPTIVHKGIY